MFPGLPTRAVDKKVQPLNGSINTNQNGPQPPNAFLGQASPQHEALADRAENELTVSYQSSDMHINGSLGVDSKIDTGSNEKDCKSNTLIDALSLSSAKTNVKLGNRF